jgi:CRP-like cAMP-binding protein
MLPDHPETLTRNGLLAALPDEDRGRLASLVQVTHLEAGVLVPAGGPVETVSFPLTAVVSFLALTDAGTAVETASVGNEGVVGASLLLGAEAIGDQELATVQVGGRAAWLPRDDFLREAGPGGALHQVISRYLHAFIAHTARQAACNALHSVRERCARWLLLAHDRVGADEFPITQESLAQLLGVRRASVTVVAGMLQRAGCIRYRRGRVTILDRAGLKTLACDCYDVIRAGFDRPRAPFVARH